MTDVFSRCQELAHRPPDGDPKAESARWREVARLAMALAHEADKKYQQTVSLVIPGDVVRDLSPNNRLCWQAKMARAKHWRSRVHIEWIAQGRPMLKPPVSVVTIVRRGRVVDRDNLVAALKNCLDGLWGEGCMLHADDNRTIERYEVLQETGKQWRANPEVEIRVSGEPL